MATPTLTLMFDHQAARVLADLSAVRQVGPHLWLGCDEGGALERLTILGDRAADHSSYPIGAFLDLPHGVEEEIDIEGIAYSDHYLWFIGSHSTKRKKPQPDETPEANWDRLSTVEREENRYTLGRIPLVEGTLSMQCPHPLRPDQILQAAQLQRKKSGNQLTQVLATDPHLGPFLTADIPGKDNGFDIEGLAVVGDRLFIGLRGPVLRGWAVLLEIAVKDNDDGYFKLKKLVGKQRYRKYFLNLQGLGIRDLCPWGDELLMLAGPTMALSGAVQIFRQPLAALVPEQPFLTPTLVQTLPHGQDCDRAEGLTQFTQGDQPQLLVVYDAPSPDRIGSNGTSVQADLIPYNP
ncbi:MAG: DUF3616 domain-containing protein [Cyanobacteria bacterium]|nr:DUF3616 domain-containing protein [Cyanobacteriota bacterium]